MMAFEHDVAGCRKTCPKFGVASIEGCISKTVRIYRNFWLPSIFFLVCTILLGKANGLLTRNGIIFELGVQTDAHTVCKQSYLWALCYKSTPWQNATHATQGCLLFQHPTIDESKRRKKYRKWIHNWIYQTHQSVLTMQLFRIITRARLAGSVINEIYIKFLHQQRW